MSAVDRLLNRAVELSVYGYTIKDLNISMREMTEDEFKVFRQIDERKHSIYRITILWSGDSESVPECVRVAAWRILEICHSSFVELVIKVTGGSKGKLPEPNDLDITMHNEDKEATMCKQSECPEDCYFWTVLYKSLISIEVSTFRCKFDISALHHATPLLRIYRKFSDRELDNRNDDETSAQILLEASPYAKHQQYYTCFHHTDEQNAIVNVNKEDLSDTEWLSQKFNFTKEREFVKEVFDVAIQLPQFKNLEKISVAGTNIVNMNGLDRCTLLESINVSRCYHLTTIILYNDLLNIVEVKAACTGLRSANWLEHCPNIESLDLSMSEHIRDLSVLSKMKKLKNPFIDGTATGEYDDDYDCNDDNNDVNNSY